MFSGVRALAVHGFRVLNTWVNEMVAIFVIEDNEEAKHTRRTGFVSLITWPA